MKNRRTLHLIGVHFRRFGYSNYINHAYMNHGLGPGREPTRDKHLTSPGNITNLGFTTTGEKNAALPHRYFSSYNSSFDHTTTEKLSTPHGTPLFTSSLSIADLTYSSSSLSIPTLTSLATSPIPIPLTTPAATRAYPGIRTFPA